MQMKTRYNFLETYHVILKYIMVLVVNKLKKWRYSRPPQYRASVDRLPQSAADFQVPNMLVSWLPYW